MGKKPKNDVRIVTTMNLTPLVLDLLREIAEADRVLRGNRGRASVSRAVRDLVVAEAERRSQGEAR
jgi:hypothetical protein